MPPVGPWGLPRPPGLGSPRGNSGRSWLPSVKLHVSSPWGPRLASVAAAGRLGLGSKRGIAAGLATLLCLRLLQTGTDGLIMLPSPEALYRRVWLPVVKPDPAAAKGLGRYKGALSAFVIGFIIAPVLQVLWFVDEALFPGYKDVKIEDPVFIAAPPRSGSTTLHRAITADSPHFVAPTLADLVVPFIPLTAALHRVKETEWLYDKVLRVGDFIVKAVGLQLGEVAKRHPMSLMEPEEDDLCMLVHHGTGELGWAISPNIESFLWACRLHEYSPEMKKRSILLLKRVFQKVLYMRGRGRRLCTKNHLIGLIPELKQEFPSAKMLTIVRAAPAQMSSFYSLQTAMSRDICWVDTTGPEYLAMRVAFIRQLNDQLVAHFGDGRCASPDGRVLVFEDFVRDAPATVCRCLDGWGVAHAEGETRARVLRYLSAGDHKHNFHNATPEEMGTTAEELEAKMGCVARHYRRLFAEGEAAAAASKAPAGEECSATSSAERLAPGPALRGAVVAEKGVDDEGGGGGGGGGGMPKSSVTAAAGSTAVAAS